MPKHPTFKAREVTAALEKAGFNRVRQKGSHLQMKRGNLLVTIPQHPGDLSPEVFRSILRQARMTLDEFLNYHR